ncbi:MAG: hypothetical protein J6R79_05180 [Bacteroidaceae bacterium]|nr:hypothetical protein [Bacteroidaceae bacterium]
MKKSYIKPETLEVLLETQGVIAMSLPAWDEEADSSVEQQSSKLEDWTFIE